MDDSAPEAADQLTPRARLGLELYRLLLDYEQQLGAFGELLDVVGPPVAKLDTVESAFASVSEVLARAPEAAAPLATLMQQHGLEGRDGPFDVGSFMRGLADRHVGEAWFFPVWQRFDRAFRRQPRLPIVLNSLLITSVSAFETLMAGVATVYYKATPQALEAVPREKEKEFSLKDLKSLGSIDDAIDLAVSRRVDELLFGNFMEWRKFYQDRLNIDLSALANDWDRLQEILQRRHVIVHNAGKASKRYVQSVSRKAEGRGVQVGNDLACTDEYLRQALDELLILGSLLICSVAEKFQNDEAPSSCSDQLQEMSYNALVEQNWTVAEALCAWGEGSASLMSDKVLFRVNRLIAVWRNKGREAIRREIEGWDVSALDTRYKFARACLLDEREKAFSYLRTMSSQGDVTPDNLLEWPLLVELREDVRFAEFLNQAGVSTDEALVMTRGSRTFHRSICSRVSGSAVVVPPQDIAARQASPCKICRPSIGEINADGDA